MEAIIQQMLPFGIGRVRRRELWHMRVIAH